MATLDDIIYVEVGMPGLPGTGVSGTDWASYTSQVATHESRLNNLKSTDLIDTSLPPRSDGMAIVWDAASQKWVSRLIAEAVRYIKSGVSVVMEHADRLNFGTGLAVTQDGTLTSQANVAVIYGSAAGTAAEGNHQHTAVNLTRSIFAATGVLSSGARTLQTLSITLPAGDWIVEAQAFVTAKNNINNGTFQFGIQIGGSTTYPEETAEYETVGGVPRLCEIETSRPLTSTGAAFNVTTRALFGSGDPVDLRTGRVIVRAWPRR